MNRTSVSDPHRACNTVVGTVGADNSGGLQPGEIFVPAALPTQQQAHIRQVIDSYRCAQSTKRVFLRLASLINIGFRRDGINHAWPRLESLAVKLGLGVSSIQRAIRWLTANGWLRYLPGSGRRQNQFQLLWRPEFSLPSAVEKPKRYACFRRIQNDLSNRSIQPEGTVPAYKERAPISNQELSPTSSSSIELLLRDTLEPFGPIDDDALRQIVRRCRAVDPAIPDEQIVHTVWELAAHKRYRTLAGFLITAAANAIQARVSRREPVRQAAVLPDIGSDAWRQDVVRQLSDPRIPEIDKQLLRRILV